MRPRLSKPIRILIADDHDIVRRGLRAVLHGHAGCKVCGEARDGREALKKARRLRPDVVVMDISMPQMDGLEATRRLLQAHPETGVLMLTTQESEQTLTRVLASGAAGCISKSDSARIIVAGVRAVARHKPFFGPCMAALAAEVRRARGIKSAAPTALSLTPRESEVLRLIVTAGKNNKQVAENLGISAKTVDAHRANIMRKLQVHSTGELINLALREKLVSL